MTANVSTILVSAFNASPVSVVLINWFQSDSQIVACGAVGRQHMVYIIQGNSFTTMMFSVYRYYIK
ncbi:hypothetical protein ACFSPU_04760 [Haoranjiania flava]|uniref:Uncharacterized protein n=1 Tax=Haoranjiania flava TaxID=1856322 RepID=A0AAE3LKW6_9BACT|nr:hypothetical protein [Haoranjiania flava]MCU7694754.1 hypothetical protein [Haoranjiania flava]